jgi:peptide/nickel transport system ATP-binding protein
VSTLQAKDLVVSAHIDGALVPAINGLSFDLAPGKILGLVGESGAGKSMVGRTIAQLLPPGFAVTSGSLLFEGEDLVRMAAARRQALLGRAIAFIPQAPMTALNPVVTIGAQFDEHLARLGAGDRKARRDRAVAMLTAARLPNAGDLLARYPHQLSGGMCQRVLIAFAFASNPRLVVADEPTTALDVTMHPPILRLIAEMQRNHGTAVIFITHDLRLAAQLCDDVVVMYAGRAVESGPARAVLSQPAHPYTRCLQLANPPMSAGRRALYVIPDQMPSLRQLKDLPGCHFAPRCPLAADVCRSGVPPLAEVAPGHGTACFKAAVAETISAMQTPAPAPVVSPRPLLEVTSLQKRYDVGGSLFSGARSIDAVKNVSFTIADNEFVALVGESGSGKSTIARLLAGIEPVSAGRILLGGDDMTSRRDNAARATRVQMVFQDPASALNPRRRIASIVTQAMEAGSRHASWDARLARTRCLEDSVSASTSRVRYAVFRKC